jgi:MinD-like ATPase involved in chromosome partitioning or flagellar assembly
VTEHPGDASPSARRPRTRSGGSAHDAANPVEPDGPSVRVELPPAPPREAPEDELAVAIDEVSVDPGAIGAQAPESTAVGLVASGGAYRGARRDTASAAGPGAAGGAAAGVSADAGAGGIVSVALADVDSLAVAELEAPPPESADELTAERLIEETRATQPAPRGGLNRAVYEATLHLVNLGDSAKVREQDALDARIRRRFEGGARFVPVLTRKGGVGKTTVTTLLGMALADARDDRIVAIDANPDRGTLAERVDRQTRETVRDVVAKATSIGGYTDFSRFVSRDATRLDILASDTDPTLSEAFDDVDYEIVAGLAARYYSIVLTDCGTGIVHAVMRATLQRADSIVIVSGGSVDEARLASETLTWLEANGFGALVRNAVVAINLATQGTHLVKVDEIEAHFQSRVREIVRIPYDPQLAAGSVVRWRQLRPVTRQAARELAALVVEGMPVERD